MEFHQLFMSAVQKNGWSQNYISKAFHINRGLLHKYFHDELLIPKPTFLMLVEAMKLTRAERDTLFEQYYIKAHGAEKLKRLKYIESTLSSLDEFYLPDNVKNSNNDFELKGFHFEDFMPLNSEDDLIRCVSYIFKKANPGEIITNYPYTVNRFDDAVFNNMVPHSDFSLSHMLLFDKGSDSIGNLNNIFRSIRWLQYQINPICSFSYSDVMEYLPFPYFFAVDSFCLLFTPQQSIGIVMKSDEVFQYLKKISSDFIKNGFPLAVFPKDMFELKNEVQRAAIQAVDSNWSMYPCMSVIADEEFIHSIIRPEVPGIEALAEMAIQHYSSGLKVSGQGYVVSALGLRRLAETGEIHEIPAALIHEAPPKQRIRFFNKLIMMAEGDKLRILDDSTFSLPESIAIDLFENVVQIDGCFQNISDHMKHRGNYVISIEDKGLRQEFADFKDYMCENKYFYSKHTAISYLRSLILICEQMDEIFV